MADLVGTVTVVEELAFYSPAYRTSPTSFAAGKSLVVGLVTLESVPSSFGKKCYRYSVYSFSMEFRAVVRR